MPTGHLRTLFVALIGGVMVLSACAGANARESDSPELGDLFTNREDQRAIAACLRDKGWDAEYNSDDGTFTTPVTPARDSDYERDMQDCLHEVGIEADGQLSAAEYDLAYEWYSDIANCLSGAGWDVPHQPTRQKFESTYDSAPWIPWSMVPAEEMHDARKACPTLNAPQQ